MANSKSWMAAARDLVMGPVLGAQRPPDEDVLAKDFYEDLIRTPMVPQRPVEDIWGDLTAADEEMRQADMDIADAKAGVKETERWLAALEREMDAVKAGIHAAKKEKLDADQLTLGGQLNQLELVEEFLKKTRVVRDAEVDLAQFQKDLVSAEVKVYQAELDLKRRAEAIQSAGPESTDLAKIVLDAAHEGENVLKLMKARADRNEDAAGRMTRLADRWIDLAQARNKLLTEDRIRSAFLLQTGFDH